MASPFVSDVNSQRKLRTASKTANMDLSYSETFDEALSNSSESNDFPLKKSQQKKRNKGSSKKNNTENFHQCDKQSPKQNSADLTTSDGKKLFSIFALSPPSRPQLNSSVNGKEEKKDPNFNSIKAQKIALLTDETKNIEIKDNSANEMTKSQKNKRNKSDKKNCVSEVVEKSDKSIREELFVKKQSIKIDKDKIDSNVLIGKASNKAMKGSNIDEQVPVSAKRQQETSNKKTAVSENIDKSSDESPSPKVVTIKKQSIAEFFQKIPNTQVSNISEGIPKLFPIFSHSPQRQHVIPNNISNDPKERVQKKRKFDDQQIDGSVKQIKIHTDVETDSMFESDNISEKNITDVTSDVQQTFAETEDSTPVKKVRKISQKGRNVTFGAAVLRSCNSTSTCSTNSNNTLENSITNSDMSADVVKTVIGKNIRRKKVKTGVLKMLPQSHKCVKRSKDKNTLRMTIKSADKSSKLFPLFLKSPAALAKKKSIKLVNSLAKKKAASIASVKLSEGVASNNLTNVVNKIKKKRGRPRKVQNCTRKSSTETDEILEELPIKKNEVVDVSSNVMEASENIKKKFGRPRKVHSSAKMNEILKGLPIEESEKVSIPDTAIQTSKRITIKAGRPRKVQSSPISPKMSSIEFKETHKGLPVKKDEIASISDNVTEVTDKIKTKVGQPRKVHHAILSPEKEEVFEKLPNESIEVDVISMNLTEGTELIVRKSLRLRSSASSMKTFLIDVDKELSNESIDEFNHQKKKNLKTSKGKKIIITASGKKGQPPSKKQKIISPKKNMSRKSGKSTEKLNFGKKTISISNETEGNMVRKSGRKQNFTLISKIALTGANRVIELSDESIEEMKLETLPKKEIQLNTEVNYNYSCNISNLGVVEKSKKVNVSLKKPENCFSFPLYSHCGQIKTSEFTINSALNINMKEEEALDNIIPIWNNIIGLTEVKTIEPATLMNAVEVQATHTISSSPEEDGETLWTNIANDYNLKEGVSESTISELTSWLKQWKSKFTKSAKRKRDNDDSFDSFSYDSNDSDDDGLSNSVILAGPPGSGKTSIVFSLANDHGFKVLEVNASSCRSGRNINHRLKEALESYHVANIKATDVKVVEEKEGNYTKAKLRVNKDTTSKKPANKGIASFFQKEKTQPVIAMGENEVSNVKNFFQPKSSTSESKSQDNSKITNEKNSDSSSQNVYVPKDLHLCSISSQTIILFDDVDVVFQEDEGFWSTIRGFLKISKKPVIFTVSRNLEIVKANFDVDIQILRLKPMISEIAIQKLQEQFKKHHRKNTNLNMELLSANSNDVRRNLLHAQFWSQPASNQKVRLDKTPFSTNTFFSDSSTVDFNSFVLDQPSSTTYKPISDYHKIGYDILHANLFSIFNVSLEGAAERKWKSVTKICEDLNVSDSDSKTETANNIPQTDLWQEACKIFEFKKKALQNGSSSKDLLLFSNILEDFSYVDTLKGHYCKNSNWISLPERLKKWTRGLPMCNDNKLACPTDFTLDASSAIQVLRIKEAHKLYSQQRKPIQDKTVPLVLEHPFPNFDNINGHNTEEHIELISSAVPAGSSINKSVLNLDYLSMLKIMGHEELLRQSRTGKRSNRFLHYFDSISLFLDKHQIEQILQQ